jgi:phage FluMu protein Com
MTSKMRMLGSQNLTDFRCPRCHALLLKVSSGKGTIEVKCRKCGYMVSMHLKEGEVA